MTTLADRPNTALLIVDVQTAVVAQAHDRNAVVAAIAALVEKARQAGVPVIWVQHASDELVPGSAAWQIVPELVPAPGEPVVAKRWGDSFEETTLEQVLAAHGVGRLIVVGAQTDACIRSTLHGAFVRGYDTVLVRDAHTTDDRTAWGGPAADVIIGHTNLYWAYQTAPGRQAGTLAAAEVDFGRAG